MNTFQVHTKDSAPEGSRTILEVAEKSMGFVPNLYGVMAESPALLEAYSAVGAIFDRSASFDATERQVVLLTAIFENDCDYCMAAHSSIAAMQRVPKEIVQALRAGERLPDARLDALSAFTRKVVRERGWVPDSDVQLFLDAGFTRGQLLEVILGVGMKTLSNYVNYVARTPLDEAFRAQAWSSPSSPERASA